jgi:ankyrin repeat protein
LKLGVDINGPNEYGTLALMMAASIGHLKVVEILLECGADINATNKHGWSALMMAASKGHLKVVQ